MKAVILAGGLGTRISEETGDKPKPMVLIDGKPILWHLMNTFSQQGINDFVLALGYRSDVIKRWVVDLNDLGGSIQIDTLTRKVSHLQRTIDLDWKVTALETGLTTMTGGRIAQSMRAFPNERLIVTYGDGLANVSIEKLLSFHEKHGKLATLTAVRPPARFGHLVLDENQVSHFGEKNQSDTGWINGGFFVLEPKVLDYISSDSEPFEAGALPKLALEGQLMAYQHDGFWQPMDTLREKQELEKFAQLETPPWLEIVN
jgi:glucose-1-phosphate cytidylyltransferase